MPRSNNRSARRRRRRVDEAPEVAEPAAPDGLTNAGEQQLCLRAISQCTHFGRFVDEPNLPREFRMSAQQRATIQQTCGEVGSVCRAYVVMLEEGGEPDQTPHDLIVNGLAELIPLHFMFDALAEAGIEEADRLWTGPRHRMWPVHPLDVANHR